MRKIAIFSDVHGNLPALEAVLKDIEVNYHPDNVFCLGDLVDYAPWHNEVIDLMAKQQIPTIMGNHDQRIVLNERATPMGKHTKEETNARLQAIDYTQRSTSAESRAYLARLPKSITQIFYNKRVMCVHGSPKSNREYVFEHHNPDSMKEWFKESNVDVICAGHTHLSFIKELEVEGEVKFYINVGSVGRTREKIGAKAVYLWLNIYPDGKIEPIIRKIDYDVQTTIEKIKASPIPNFYAKYLEERLRSNS